MKLLDESSDELDQADYRMNGYGSLMCKTSELLQNMYFYEDDSGDRVLRMSDLRYLDFYKSHAVIPFKPNR